MYEIKEYPVNSRRKTGTFYQARPQRFVDRAEFVWKFAVDVTITARDWDDHLVFSFRARKMKVDINHIMYVYRANFIKIQMSRNWSEIWVSKVLSSRSMGWIIFSMIEYWPLISHENFSVTLAHYPLIQRGAFPGHQFFDSADAGLRQRN